MAGAYFNILKGDNYSLTTNVALGGTGVDLSTATLWFLAKGDPDDADADAIVNITNSNGIAISGANNNVVTVTLNSAVTANLTASNVLWWALRCNTNVGLVYTLDRGRMRVANSVVRRVS